MDPVHKDPDLWCWIASTHERGHTQGYPLKSARRFSSRDIVLARYYEGVKRRGRIR